MSSSPSHSRKKGFTLIEVLVGLSVMAIALVAVIKSSLQVQESLIRTKEQNLVAELATNKLARIKAQGVDKVLLWSGDFENHPSYHWELDISPTSIEGMKDIRLFIFKKSRPNHKNLFQEYVLLRPASVAEQWP